MDNGTPTLPNDLEQPVASTPPAATPPPIVPPTPTAPPPPDVPEESPKPIKPKSNLKKNLPKIAGGLLVMALLIGGILAGGNLLQQRTQVEQQATCKEGSVTNKGKSRETCVDGKKVESKIPEAEWSKLKDTETQTKTNLLKDVTFEAADGKTGQEVLDKTVNDLLSGRSGVWEVDSSQDLPFCYAAPTASECIVGRGGAGEFTGIAYYCPNDFGSSVGGEPGGCTGTGVITLADFLSGNFCGTVQVDNISGTGGYDKRSTKGCKEEEKEEAERQIASQPNPSPPPGASPSPTPSPTSSYSCVDLTKDKAAPTMGDTVKFTCEANFSAVSPVAFFRHNVDGGSYTTSTAVNVDLTSKLATYSATINQAGAWLAECRVCTDSSATSCTAWGQAN